MTKLLFPLEINDSEIPQKDYDPRIRSFTNASSDIRQYFKASSSDEPERTMKRKIEAEESPKPPDGTA